jgi:co-chaperonin GroES (HSP10)
MQLLGNRILVRVIKTNPKRGSLYLPEQKDTCEAQVLAVGDEVNNLASGDRVIFDRYGGVEFKNPEFEDAVLFSEKDILAKVEA